MPNLENITRKIKRHGVLPCVHIAAVRIANAVAPLNILRGVCIEDVDPAFLEMPAGYEGRMLTADLARPFIGDNELSDAFIDAALGRGDECYAIFHGATLAAYGWYARGATPIGVDDLAIRFRPDYVYMYKGFTHPEHRGKRLHAVGMASAMRAYQRQGFRGLVSYVESTNFDSLKSCFRMGYRQFGSIYLAKIGGRHRAFASPGCAPFRFSVAPLERGTDGAAIFAKS